MTNLWFGTGSQTAGASHRQIEDVHHVTPPLSKSSVHCTVLLLYCQDRPPSRPHIGPELERVGRKSGERIPPSGAFSGKTVDGMRRWSVIVPQKGAAVIESRRNALPLFRPTTLLSTAEARRVIRPRPCPRLPP